MPNKTGGSKAGPADERDIRGGHGGWKPAIPRMVRPSAQVSGHLSRLKVPLAQALTALFCVPQR